ncbi:MAG: hypothetical protein KKH28_11395 [Elusimicrobia bacterium]|nr:hypothetical protein [Elusimicrobiota bacterium]
MAKAEPLSIFVCGGSAMIMEGFVDRATRDVDILALAVEKTPGRLEAQSAELLPGAFQKAAADTGPGKHVNDLLALKPAEREIEAAAKWVLAQDVSAHFRFILKDMLQKLGYGKVSDRI